MSKQVQEAYIVAASRTPIGKSGRGYFKNTRSDDLLIRALQSALAQVPTLDPAAIEDAIIGCSFPEGEQGMNMARIAVALAGLPNGVGGVTVNRFCASGLTAIQMAADRIRVGEADVMIAGGAESMSLVPMGGNKPSFNPAVFAKDENVGIAYGMGLTAEKVANQWKVSREDQDAFALASHQKALKAQAAGEFADEICAFDVIDRTPNLATGEITLSTRTVSLDEGARPDTSLEGLAKLRPVFAAKGSVTAGNSSQTSDGAGALILASEKAVKQFGLTPLAKFRSFASRGVPPEIMGIGPIAAIPAALGYAGLKQDDIGWIELNEAFAAQSLAVIRDLGLNPEVVNPMGGAIALGHPLGATGAIRAATVVHALRRHQLQYGMVTMCVGTGQGAAGIFERV
jgi:acetyl-CoA acyltransferase